MSSDVSVFEQTSPPAGIADSAKEPTKSLNPVGLAVYTFFRTRYMFPVLPELAIVSILHGEAKDVVPIQQKPSRPSWISHIDEPQIIRVDPEGAGRVAGR